MVSKKSLWKPSRKSWGYNGKNSRVISICLSFNTEKRWNKLETNRYSRNYYECISYTSLKNFEIRKIVWTLICDVKTCINQMLNESQTNER